MFKTIRELFKRIELFNRSVACECGGRISEHLTFHGSIYKCNKCRKDISQIDFLFFRKK